MNKHPTPECLAMRPTTAGSPSGAWARTAFALVLGTCLLSACGGSALQQANLEAAQANPGTYVIKAPFDEREVAQAMRRGNSRVEGVVEVRKGGWASYMSGAAATGVAGLDVTLVPMTAYWRSFEKEWDQYFPPGYGFPPPGRPKPLYDERMEKYISRAKTDQFGRYTFNQLSPGKYRVIVWFTRSFYTTQTFNAGTYHTPYGRVDRTENRRQREDVAEEMRKVVEITQDGTAVEASFWRAHPTNFRAGN